MAMNWRRNLITSPLDWFLSANPVPPPAIPVLAERGSTQLKTPRPVLVVDTREQNPFDFSRFEGWFAGVEHRALKLGDYSIAGLEDICVVERKDLADLVHSFTATRSVFVEPTETNDHVPASFARCHGCTEPGEVSIPSGSSQPQSHFPISDCVAGWIQHSVSLHGDARTGRGSGGVVPLSRASLPLARNQRLRPVSGRPGSLEPG